MPRVSVIVPTYNHSKFLYERLDSIFNQRFSDFEVILLDDCSSDDSFDVLRVYVDHPKVSCLIRNEENSGTTFKQWQKGFALAKGEFVWIAESDDIADLGFLETLVPTLMRNSDVGIGFCQSYRIDEHGRTLGIKPVSSSQIREGIWDNDFKMAGRIAVRDLFMIKNVIPNVSAVLFRRAAVTQVASGYTTFKYSGDWFFYVQVLMNWNLYYAAEPLNYYRFHSGVTRIRDNKKKYSTYLYEVYQIVHFIQKQFEPSFARAEMVLYRLTKEFYQQLGIAYMFSKTGRQLVRQILMIDGLFWKRIFVVIFWRIVAIPRKWYGLSRT